MDIKTERKSIIKTMAVISVLEVAAVMGLTLAFMYGGLSFKYFLIFLLSVILTAGFFMTRAAMKMGKLAALEKSAVENKGPEN